MTDVADITEKMIKKLWDDGSPICGGDQKRLKELIVRKLSKMDYNDSDINGAAKWVATQMENEQLDMIGPLIDDYKYVLGEIWKEIKNNE